MSVSDSQIREYVLGTLQGAAADEIDFLLFTDADFAEEVLSVEEELVRDHLRGELPAAARQHFDARLRVDPILRAKVNEVRALASMLADTAPTETVSREAAGRDLWGWLRSPRLAWALSLTLLGTCIWLTVRSLHLDDQVALLEAENGRLRATRGQTPTTEGTLPPVQFELSPGVRLSDAVGRRLSIPVAAREVLLLLTQRVETEAGARFRVIIQDPDGDEIWSGPAARRGGNIEVRVPAGRLASGDYLATIQIAASGGRYRELESYSFAVIREH
jgi:hypothetical protein